MSGAQEACNDPFPRKSNMVCLRNNWLTFLDLGTLLLSFKPFVPYSLI